MFVRPFKEENTSSESAGFGTIKITMNKKKEAGNNTVFINLKESEGE